MLTVLKANEQSLLFFSKLGYKTDETNPDEDDEPVDYSILSKKISQS